MVKRQFSKIFSKKIEIVKNFSKSKKVRQLYVDSTKLNNQLNAKHSDKIEDTITEFLNYLSET